MKKTTFRKFIVASVSLLLTLGGVAWACGWWYDEDEANFSLFAPEVIHDASYQPFFRTFHTLYQYNGTWNNVSNFNMVNVQEWQDFFQNKVDTASLNYLLYAAKVMDLDTMIHYLKKESYPISNALKNNSVLQYADKVTASDFLYYLGFAKRCEPFVTYLDDSWGESKTDNPRNNTSAMNKLIQRGTKTMLATKNEFIRQRYLFQLVRMYFYSGDDNACIKFYHEHAQEFTLDNSLKYRAMGYAAGASFHIKNYAEANYLYSQVYDHSPLLKVSAYLGFHPVEELDWQACMTLAKSVREKNVLWHLLGIYADPLRAMTEIYKTEPESDLLDLLLVRAVNIEEEKFVPLRYFEGGSMNDSCLAFNKNKISTNLFNFIKSVADKGNTHKPCVWDMAAGYLYLASAEFKKAEKYFDKAQKTAANDTLINKQIRLLQIANLIEKTKKPDRNFEEKILGELLWLKSDNQQALRNANAYEWALKRLSEKYAQNKDIIRSECLDFMRNPHFYNDTVNAAQMLVFMDKLNRTEFEKFILSVHPYKQADIIDFQAVQLAYQHKFKEALAKYNSYTCTGGELPGDPFLIHINDCHDCDHANPPTKKYTKASFLEKMLELQQKVENNSAEATKASFLLANGYYNMTYFGNARAMYETNISGYIDYYPFNGYMDYSKEIKKETSLYECGTAEHYYKKAMELSTDREFKAKCCFMAAKCEQNAFFLAIPKDYKGDFQSGKYFELLKADYSKTRYYKEIIKECGYFRTFLDKR